MTGQYAVFLRGINVGGITIRMEDLKALFAALGFSGVSTILASGNVIATAPASPPGRSALQALIERELSARFEYEAHVILRDPGEIAALMAAAQSVAVPAETHFYVLLCDDVNLPAELQALYHSMPHLPGEAFQPAGANAFWLVPKGTTLASNFGGKVLGSKRFKARLTSRNLNTIEKIHKRMSGT